MNIADQAADLRERATDARINGQYELSVLFYELAVALETRDPSTVRDALLRGLYLIDGERR